MYNDYIIIGPKNKYNLSNCNSYADILNLIKNNQYIFISRGDNSGTHKKELSLWSSIDLDPDYFGAWYKQIGQGMGPTLNIANSLNAFTLTDRGTWITFNNKKNLNVICENSPLLINQYGIIAVNPKLHKRVNYELAYKYIEWLLSLKGKNLINNFRKNNQQLFYFNYNKKKDPAS